MTGIEIDPAPNSSNLTVGKRFTLILDHVQFHPKRGRSNALLEYLCAKRGAELGDLKLNTVRSWFGTSSPTVASTRAVLRALNEDYPFNASVESVASWWKLGGTYPFGPNMSTKEKEILSLNIMRLLSTEAGDDFSKLPPDQLLEIKALALSLAQEFSDPGLRVCPELYLSAIIRDGINRIKKTCL